MGRDEKSGGSSPSLTKALSPLGVTVCVFSHILDLSAIGRLAEECNRAAARAT